MKTITGTWLFPSGAPAAGATLRLKLNQDAGEAGVGQFAQVPDDITLDSNGSIPASTQIIANDEIQPTGTYYTIEVIDDTYGTIYFEKLAISGTSPIDLNRLVPLAKS